MVLVGAFGHLGAGTLACLIAAGIEDRRSDEEGVVATRIGAYNIEWFNNHFQANNKMKTTARYASRWRTL